MSDNGRYGLTLIAFVGSVFSPYYFAGRKAGKSNPNHYCAINVALSGKRVYPWTQGWSMTERDASAVRRTPATLSVGPSKLTWNGRTLEAEIDETTSPIPTRLRGQITLTPLCLTKTTALLDRDGAHRWSPIAPLARVEVRLEHPKLSWSGRAYLDSNFGSAPLESAFRNWHWSRTIEPDQTRVLYDVTRADGETGSLAIAFDKTGAVAMVEAASTVRLARTLWQMPRHTRADTPGQARVLNTWEDGPFYARSLIETTLGGERVKAVHESLSLDRFTSPVVQWMLPYRMPRQEAEG